MCTGVVCMYDHLSTWRPEEVLDPLEWSNRQLCADVGVPGIQLWPRVAGALNLSSVSSAVGSQFYTAPSTLQCAPIALPGHLIDCTPLEGSNHFSLVLVCVIYVESIIYLFGTDRYR